MKEKDTNKTKWLHTRLTEDEYSKLLAQFKKTTCRKLSQYIRNKLFDKPLTVLYRNQSLDDFMAELMPLKKSLYALSNNFNQAVRKLNSMKQTDNAEHWVIAYELTKRNVEKQVDEIKNHIQKIGESWLQSSTPTPPSEGR
jgi:acetone carboxylase gamma subunit